MNGAQAITHALQQHGVEHIFGYPGGCIMPLYDALPESPLQHILCRHEQAAALAADGYARASGKLGVCVATSGPGATNLITGVANAFMDSIPMLVITGQVPSGLIGTDAFQEADILGMSLGVVKHSYLVDRADELPRIMAEAIALACSGRPGPVWVDIPKDILLTEITAEAVMEMPAFSELQPTATSPAPVTSLRTAASLIASAQRPLLYTGGGVGAAGAVETLRAFSAATGIPQVVTLKGIGNPAADDPLNFGMLGMHGSVAANTAVSECDLLIAVGVRFDDRATGNTRGFAANANIIHLDIDTAEFNKNKNIDCALPGCLIKNLTALTASASASSSVNPACQQTIEPWRQRCAQLIKHKGFDFSASSQGMITGPDFLQQLNTAMPQATICCDVGQHQMWVAQAMQFAHPSQHLSSGGLGTMGFGLPAAIGAALAAPEKPVINITGDGSFMMNMQELATLTRYRLPVKILVLNNQCLGMVRQQQELFYAGRYSEIDLSDNPDFAAVARAFGIPSITVSTQEEIPAALLALENSHGPMLINVMVAPETNVWPIVKPGASNHEMLTA